MFQPEPDLPRAVSPASAATLRAGLSRVNFCGMPFDRIAPAEVLDAIGARPTAAPFAYLTTPNVDHVVRLWRSDENVAPLYRDAWLTVCDSRVLAALSVIAGLRLPVSTGADLTEALLERIADSSEELNVIGTTDDVVAALQSRYPRARVNHFKPSMRLRENPEEIAECVRFIERHPARFTFLAVGSPQQEMIARAAWTRGKACGLGLCIGAALHFSAGVLPRAPRWMQVAKLEWMHRLWKEPRRLAYRYLVKDMLIFVMFSRHMLAALTADEKS